MDTPVTLSSIFQDNLDCQLTSQEIGAYTLMWAVSPAKPPDIGIEHHSLEYGRADSSAHLKHLPVALAWRNLYVPRR